MKIHKASNLVSCLLLVRLCVYRFLVNRTTLFLNAFYFDLWIYVAVVQLLIVVYILLRSPQNKLRQTILALLPASVLLGSVYLIYVGTFDWVVIWVLELAVCITLISLFGASFQEGFLVSFPDRQVVLKNENLHCGFGLQE